VEQSDPGVVAIFGGDHIYRMNIASMIEYHLQKGAEVTVAAIPTEKKHAAEFGVIETAPDGHILGFHEKNPDAPTMPGDPERVLASMGNYVFSTRTLLRLLHDDAAEAESNHDFGRDILPKLAGKAEIYAYDFQTNRIPGERPDSEPYWRDVGTIDAYYQANMDLRSVRPALNLYNREWPVRTTSYPDPPAKFTFDDENRRGQAIDSIVSGGCILSGGTVRNSIVGRGVRIHSGAVVEDSVILDNCDIGRRSKIRRVILDKNVRVPEDAMIGYDLERDRINHHVTESGLVVVSGDRTKVDITGLVVA
jgi:glucose-1-phosphate adenylyltransferase